MPELRDALINLDPKLATPENCSTLMNFCPDADEIALCKGNDVPLEELDMVNYSGVTQILGKSIFDRYVRGPKNANQT